MDGILNINKPSGITSTAVVSKVKWILQTKTVGHMGTLDPQGEGVLLIGVGKGTKLFDYLLKKDKVYEANFEFGYETDTLDKDGKVVKTCEKIPSLDELNFNIKSLLGKIQQLPPNYSAKNINGERAYKLAREGKEVILKPSEIEIFDIKIIQINKSTFKFIIHSSSGTYIRSICRDIAYLCNSLATMTSIIRLRSGKYLIENSINLDELVQIKENAIESLDKALSKLHRYDLRPNHKKQLDNGMTMHISALNDTPKTEKFLIYCDNILYGIAIQKDNYFKLKTYLKS
ncbi:MAG: tRNA pseudouridine(55) synthase TruB [Firmicutes bacterium]|nr:tRNA pseudouridine(55) synthase TruB [Bacillota bacterium]